MFAPRGRATRGALSIALAALPLIVWSTAEAVPITYAFTTGIKNESASGPFLAGALTGLSVAGTFVYDDEAPVLSSFGGITIHAGAISSLSGRVGELEFSDPSGQAHVANDSFTPFAPALPFPPPPPPEPPPPPPPGDLLMLLADALAFPPPPETDDLAGFTLPGLNLPLLNVRLFWVETLLLPTGFTYLASGEPIFDFLVDNQLPGTLPAFGGRLALDFPGQLPDGTPVLRSAFFDDLVVTPVSVPEPGMLSLLAVGLVPLLGRRFRHCVRTARRN